MKLHSSLTMRVVILATLFISTLLMAETVHQKEKVTLTNEYLAAGEWLIPTEGSGTCNGEAIAKFTADGHYSMFKECGNAEDFLNISGSYKI